MVLSLGIHGQKVNVSHSLFSNKNIQGNDSKYSILFYPINQLLGAKGYTSTFREGEPVSRRMGIEGIGQVGKHNSYHVVNFFLI